MSVINRMLRDLDQRQQHQSGGTYTPAAMAPQPLHWSWMIGIAVGSAIVVIAVLNVYWWWTKVDPVAQPTVETQLATTAPRTASPKNELNRTEVADQESDVGNSATDKDSLLSSETIPETNSSPALQPGPVKPKELPTVPTVAAEIELAESIDSATAAERADTNRETEDSVDSEPAIEPANNPSTFAVERVQLSPNELAETNLQKARSALRRGEREQGQELLEKALTVMPEHVAVRSELAAYWYGRGFATRAVAILQQGLDLVPQQSQWQLLLGRILEQMGRVEDAYMALQSLDSSTAEYPGLVEVRGNAANQLSYFSEAAQDFLALANLTNEGRWWLAAAVAFEDAGEPKAAFRAYQQAAFARDLGVDARRYAEDRLQALGGS